MATMGKSRATAVAAESTAARYRRIYEAVAAIPRGRVSSYGAVARRAGFARGARLVGRALAECPDDVPWHRVVSAAGRISLPAHSAPAREQRRRLHAEGVAMRDGRVAAQFFQTPDERLDALLWGPGGTAAGCDAWAGRSGS